MGDSIEIRAASDDDLEWVEGLLRESGLPVEGVAGHLDGLFAVAESGGEPAGVCGIEVSGKRALLRSLAVYPRWRGRSAGSALVRDRIEWARNRGVREIYLLTTDAGPYLERFGFRRVSREDVPSEIRGSQEFSALCPETAVAMVMHLDDGGPPRTRHRENSHGRDGSK